MQRIGYCIICEGVQHFIIVRGNVTTIMCLIADNEKCSAHGVFPSQEAVGAADDCLQIEVYRDLPGRRLLLQYFRDPAPPPAALLASALHALGSDAPMQEKAEDVPVLFECEGCGLRFRDCTAAVCHERLCLAVATGTSASQSNGRSDQEQRDALQWLMQVAMGSAEVPDARVNSHSFSTHKTELSASCVDDCPVPMATPDYSGHAPGSAASWDLHTLEGPGGRSGTRLGHRFWERLSLGDRVSWERSGRFFPHRGEGADEAAERALAFACNTNTGRNYAQANWDDPDDVTAISKHLIAPIDIQPAACDADERPTRQS